MKHFARKAGWIVSGLIVAAIGQAGAVEMITIPEGTDVQLQLVDHLSSADATEGQRFNLILDQDLRVGNQVVAMHGAKAVGTVASVHKRGHMGKPGELNVLLNYVLIGDQRVPLRGSSGKEGHDKVGTTVVLTVLFGPLGLLKRGKDIEINPGTVLSAYVDSATQIPAMGTSTMPVNSPQTVPVAQPDTAATH